MKYRCKKPCMGDGCYFTDIPQKTFKDFVNIIEVNK